MSWTNSAWTSSWPLALSACGSESGAAVALRALFESLLGAVAGGGLGEHGLHRLDLGQSHESFVWSLKRRAPGVRPAWLLA